MRVPLTVADVAVPTVVVAATDSCESLDSAFRGDPALASVAVVEDERIGLVMRDAFAQIMSGPFGYGRTLWARRAVGEVADWTPTRVRGSETIVAAAQRLRTRPGDRRYDDVLVDAPGGDIHRASPADLFDALARQFAYRATHDDLTGVLNRAHFLELLSDLCGRDTGKVLLAVVDLDGMKKINDSSGHHVGDAVLTRAAAHLRNAAGPGELVARLGADEFAVVSAVSHDAPSLASATELGQRCRRAIAAPDGSGPGYGPVHASVGVAISGSACDPVTLLAEADMAMFRAKQAGGDQVECTVDVGAELVGDVDAVDRTVIEAIRDGELEVWYQPIRRIRDRAIISIEALVRWRHPGLGLLGPDRFLAGAARAGHLPALDRWVLHRACADFAGIIARHGAAAPERVAVNLAPATLATDFDVVVRQALAAADLPPTRLRLELPEGADLATLAEATARIERLRRLGVEVVLDDMGAGSTSLRHLSAVTISGLKIDAAFVAGMLHNPRDHTVVKLLADLGRGLDIPVTAEGVEHLDQLVALADLDIDHAQGFLLGRPEPLAAVGPALEWSGHVETPAARGRAARN